MDSLFHCPVGFNQGDAAIIPQSPINYSGASGTSSNELTTSAGTRQGCIVENLMNAQFVEATANRFPSAGRTSS